MLVFFATQALPGDTATAILGREATPVRLAAVRDQLGLNQPVPVRYLNWLHGLLTGELGNSFANGYPVREYLGGRIVNSFALMVASVFVGAPLALLLGAVTAAKRDTAIDNVASVFMLALAALPEFVIGISLIILLSTGLLNLLPAVSVVDPTRAIWLQAEALVLPTLTLAIAITPYVARMIRGSMVEVLESDYIEMARLKGLPEPIVVMRHAIPNAIGPTIQVMALQWAWLAGGVVVTEYVFGYPGMGSALIDAVANRDVPVIQALVLLIAGTYVVANLLADVLTMMATPRARTALR